MTDYFVDPVGGDDANEGTDPDAPFASVARGLAALGSGDVLNLHAASTYGPTMVFSAALPDGIVVQPYAGGRVLVDGRVRSPDLGTVPNEGWERVVGGHRDEWRTRDTFEVPIPGDRDLARVRYGSFTESRLRLITYARLDDLRAASESFVTVPLSDPRPAGGPLFLDRAHKRPWTYLGPGLTWVFEDPEDLTNRRGRVHVRLSPTHLRSPATRDYNGPSDPNAVGLALSAEGRVTVAVGASNLELRRFVIANGGTTTLHVTDAARDVTFDHCDVFGGRFGVRVSGKAARIAFRHCTFDGALAPWTVRSDIKSEYDFVDTDGISKVHNGLGAETHDMLVITHAADTVEFDHCAFRRAHDAVQLGGDDVSIHHCLFEDVNDEVVQFHRTSNARVFKNLMRQVLHPFSFALKQHGGPVYIYRNVIDQRLPTRGHRTLPPDAPAAHVSRYGASYKTGFPMPATYVYQNTFVGADRDDKGSALSVLFARSDLSPSSARIHLNNIVVGLDVDEPLMWVATSSPVRRSDGNLWYSPQRIDAPLALRDLPGGEIERIRTVERLHELGWELTSRFIEPGLRNFDDEIFQHGRYLGDEQPNNDWRPAPGSPAIGAGIDLPDNLPDPDRPLFGLRPDIGAMKATAPPLRVGVDDEVVLPAPQRPIASVGADQLIVDSDGDGFANVTLDGTASTATTGVLTGHTWSIDSVKIASGPIATVQLAEGHHLVRLEVRNSVGHTDTDSTRIAIRPVRPHGPNLIAAGGFEERVPWRLRNATIVAGPVHSGSRALRMETSKAASAGQRTAVNPGTRYRLSAWIQRMPLAARPLRVQITHLDADGATIDVEQFTFTGTASYTYRQAIVVTPENAVTVELVLSADPMPGAVFVDDVRLIDDNLLVNGGFETRPANGRDDESPGWRFEAGGARVETDEVRSGRRAVAIEGLATDFRQVTQEIRDLAGASQLRVTAWLRTEDVSEPPTIAARFDVEGNLIIAEETSEIEWSLVGRIIDVPAGAERLTLHVRVERGTTGTTYVDDILVVPVSADDPAATRSLRTRTRSLASR